MISFFFALAVSSSPLIAAVSDAVVNVIYRQKLQDQIVIRVHDRDYRLPFARVVAPKNPVTGDIIQVRVTEGELLVLMKPLAERDLKKQKTRQD